MKTNPAIYIHIGYPKCCSTHLQKHLFSQSTYFNYIGPFSDDNERFTLFKELLLDTETMHFDILKLSRLLVFSNDKPILISLETIVTGSPSPAYVSNHEILNRLKTIAPSAKIFLIIRNQLSFLESVYSQLVGGSNKLNMTFSAFISELFQFHRGSWLSRIDYYSVIQLIHQLFGRQNTFVVPLELLKTKRSQFNMDLSKFLDNNIDLSTIDAIWSLPSQNKRRTWLHYFAIRIRSSKLSILMNILSYIPRPWKNKLQEYSLHLSKSSYALPPYNKEKLYQHFASVNNNISEVIEYDLSNFDYPGF